MQYTLCTCKKQQQQYHQHDQGHVHAGILVGRLNLATGLSLRPKSCRLSLPPSATVPSISNENVRET